MLGMTLILSSINLSPLLNYYYLFLRASLTIQRVSYSSWWFKAIILN